MRHPPRRKIFSKAMQTRYEMQGGTCIKYTSAVHMIENPYIRVVKIAKKKKWTISM